MKTRTLLQIGFAGAAAMCMLVGLAGSLALRQVHGIDNDVQGMERLQNRVNAALRASGDLVMTSGSSDTRKGLDAARSALHATLDGEDGAALDPALATQLQALAGQIDALAAIKKPAPDDDDSLIAYGKLNSSAAQALTALDEAGTALQARADTRTRQALALAAGVALLSVGGVFVCSSIVRRRLEGRLGGQLEDAMALMRRVGGGDLTPITTSAHPKSMVGALATMTHDLGQLIGSVRGTVDELSSAAAQIAGGNTDLSHRTETTASRLQQACSAMTELTGSVGQTADSARTATELAASAASVASRGGHAVAQVVSTMNEINASSRKIADIIGTIDGIAFQTNILALNAAVEAARAGEQGRGFAVVASEVRSLAGRSAEAAREIKALIGASVDRVEAGSRQVADAGSTMTEIVASVQRVSDLIGDITHAAAAQSGGIGAVNQTVSELDGMTQQNAALVEQSAAAAESLKDQAQRLSTSVARFRLGQAA